MGVLNPLCCDMVLWCLLSTGFGEGAVTLTSDCCWVDGVFRKQVKSRVFLKLREFRARLLKSGLFYG